MNLAKPEISNYNLKNIYRSKIKIGLKKWPNLYSNKIYMHI